MPDSTLRVVEHPLIEHKLSLLRDVGTESRYFRELVNEITMLMAFRATECLEGEEVAFETPLAAMRARRIREDRVVVVPVLRAGLGMVEGMLRMIPGARVGHLGFERNEETLEPRRYYGKLPPESHQYSFLLVDPMLGTGGTASASIADLKERGVTRIVFVCLVAAPEGAGRLAAEHPDVPVYAAALDRQLNEIGYIVPGLGDAGDRLYGTL
ncbi:MAG: uracil phosphoribosyltransferase [Gemmatimonadetes bacterium]|nr:uracil phosphoribosyltransferase [Gemmatimonadota bacterium]MYD13831.1 uracil phosphoribosyltransferase [Gemmatimonadota bacterium]MYI65457.1 uracil phosphoribosyltransferase [Gemmatimonadota bacterium]